MISLDVDGVLLDYMNKILEIYNRLYNTRASLSEFTTWDYVVKTYPGAEKLFSVPEIYNLVEPIDGAQDFVKTLVDRYGVENIQFVTSSHGKILEAKNRKLKEVFGFIKDFDKIPVEHVGLIEEGQHDKSKYTNGTILVDDAPHNIEDHLNNNRDDIGIIVDFNYPWTKVLDSSIDNIRLFKATSYDDILDIIKSVNDNKLQYEMEF